MIDFDTFTKIAWEWERFGQIDCCQRLYKVAQSSINRSIWSHCRYDSRAFTYKIGYRIRCKKQILEFQSWNKALWLFKNISLNFEQPIKMLYSKMCLWHRLQVKQRSGKVNPYNKIQSEPRFCVITLIFYLTCCPPKQRLLSNSHQNIPTWYYYDNWTR